MPEVIIHGIRLYYEEAGSGYPLILLHGLGQNIESLRNEILEFQRDFRVIALDSRGHGRSAKPDRYSLDDHIRDTIAWMDHMGIDQAYIMGGSMGSYIAQGVAIKVPERVKKLVLVSAKPNGLTSSMVRLYAEHADELVGMTEEQKQQHMFRYIFHNRVLAGKWIREANEAGHVLTGKEQEAANQALEGFDFRADLPLVTALTLLISGKYDGVNPPEQAEEIQRLIQGSELLVFEHSGHAPNAEEPERFIETVRRFLLD
ncbi:alpha/beta fold hydrolase [Paenibacillus sp. XY044]|uniref:alpha/beta fold hydrolase n=1 Tax=Paenibacillus sp. XY044 TaxID=2026089 RepID=UPI000B9813F0|nr:alpha/beta fold hydrolase [Paenibacillus sp. XY044]OZB98465.1 hypothetical protein CJP46_04760 [Paenibacillus sp. XY044]